eukprot:6193043-Pleurochrysis_carterae.AAC.1
MRMRARARARAHARARARARAYAHAHAYAYAHALAHAHAHAHARAHAHAHAYAHAHAQTTHALHPSPPRPRPPSSVFFVDSRVSQDQGRARVSPEREHESRKINSSFVRQPRHLPIVDQPQLPVGAQQHVPGVPAKSGAHKLVEEQSKRGGEKAEKDAEKQRVAEKLEKSPRTEGLKEGSEVDGTERTKTTKRSGTSTRRLAAQMRSHRQVDFKMCKACMRRRELFNGHS